MVSFAHIASMVPTVSRVRPNDRTGMSKGIGSGMNSPETICMKFTTIWSILAEGMVIVANLFQGVDAIQITPMMRYAPAI
jgi:hypothetical protein